MFCPQCESEYREGTVRCSDCDVPLVTELAEEPPQPKGLLPIVEETSSELIAELLDRFEKAGVPYVVEAGTAVSMIGDPELLLDEPEPWQARVWIAQSFAERAKRILQQIDDHFGRRRLMDTE